MTKELTEVEAVAEALFASLAGDHRRWDTTREFSKGQYRAIARTAIEAHKAHLSASVSGQPAAEIIASVICQRGCPARAHNGKCSTEDGRCVIGPSQKVTANLILAALSASGCVIVPREGSADEEQERRHHLHLAWRLRNGEEFKNLPPIAADEIKQAAAVLEGNPEPRGVDQPCATCPWTIKGCSPGACRHEQAGQ